MKNMVVCENLRYPTDEGASKLAVQFIKSLDKETKIINFGEKIEIGGVEATAITRSNLAILGFIFNRLVSFFYILKIKPESIYYFPLGAPKIVNQIYASILNWLTPNFKEIVFQTGDFTEFLKFFSNFRIAVFSKKSFEILKDQGLRVEYLSMPIILPSKIYDKIEMRRKYGINEEDFVILHIGHLEDGRGLDILSELAESTPEAKIMLVLSSRSRMNAENLLSPKIKVINKYINDIYEIYATADVYLFPIRSKGSAIDAPLSIFEAKAMNLPVIASDIGSIKETLGGYKSGHLIKVSDKKEMVKDIKNILINIKK